MITPQKIAQQFDWDITMLRLFCAAILEDANDHQTAAALQAHAIGEQNLAKGFLEVAHDVDVRGRMTEENRERAGHLHETLKDEFTQHCVSFYPWEE